MASPSTSSPNFAAGGDWNDIDRLAKMGRAQPEPAALTLPLGRLQRRLRTRPRTSPPPLLQPLRLGVRQDAEDRLHHPLPQVRRRWRRRARSRRRRRQGDAATTVPPAASRRTAAARTAAVAAAATAAVATAAAAADGGGISPRAFDQAQLAPVAPETGRRRRLAPDSVFGHGPCGPAFEGGFPGVPVVAGSGQAYPRRLLTTA